MAAFVRATPTDLLEVEDAPELRRLVAQITRPLQAHRTRIAAALATDNDPVRGVIVEHDRAKQWLETAEGEQRAESFASLFQLPLVAVIVALVAERRAERSIGREAAALNRHIHRVADALRQVEHDEVRAFPRPVESLAPPSHRNPVVPDVAKAEREDERARARRLRSPVPFAQLRPCRPGCADAVAVIAPGDTAITRIHERFRIAVVARRADLGASDPWIPGMIGPLDFRVLCHKIPAPLIRLTRRPLRNCSDPAAKPPPSHCVGSRLNYSTRTKACCALHQCQSPDRLIVSVIPKRPFLTTRLRARGGVDSGVALLMEVRVISGAAGGCEDHDHHQSLRRSRGRRSPKQQPIRGTRSAIGYAIHPD